MRRLFAAPLALAFAACAGRSAPSTPAPAGTPAARAATATPPGDPTSLRYAAGTGRYRIETQVHTSQEVMGQPQTADVTTLQLVSMSLTPAGEGFTLTATIDSITLTMAGAAAGQAAADAGRAMMGKRFTGMMTAAGRVTSLTSPDSATPGVAAAMSGMRDFFPAVPGTLTAGNTWTDTVTTTQPIEMFTLTTRAVREHRVAGWEQRDGVRALRITTTSDYTVSGSGDAQGQPLELAGSGRSTSDRYISAAGVYLGAAESDSSNMNVNVVAMGMSIPVLRTQRATIARLP